MRILATKDKKKYGHSQKMMKNSRLLIKIKHSKHQYRDQQYNNYV